MKTVRTFAHLVLFARRPQNVAEHPPRSKPAGLRSATLTLGVVVASGVLGSFASTASAAPALCEAAIATCSLESASEPKLESEADTSEAEAAVAEARQACRALRSCDKVCGVDLFRAMAKERRAVVQRTVPGQAPAGPAPVHSNLQDLSPARSQDRRRDGQAKPAAMRGALPAAIQDTGVSGRPAAGRGYSCAGRPAVRGRSLERLPPPRPQLMDYARVMMTSIRKGGRQPGADRHDRVLLDARLQGRRPRSAQRPGGQRFSGSRVRDQTGLFGATGADELEHRPGRPRPFDGRPAQSRPRGMTRRRSANERSAARAWRGGAQRPRL